MNTIAPTRARKSVAALASVPVHRLDAAREDCLGATGGMASSRSGDYARLRHGHDGPGSAGSNTVTDHLQIVDTAVPARNRRRLMVTCDGDGDGASHGLIEHLDELTSRPGLKLTYSVGWELGARERTAIRLVPAETWQIAIGAAGAVRELRADDACENRCCAHRRCWIEEAHVTLLAWLAHLALDGPRPRRAENPAPRSCTPPPG